MNEVINALNPCQQVKKYINNNQNMDIAMQRDTMYMYSTKIYTFLTSVWVHINDHTHVSRHCNLISVSWPTELLWENTIAK